VIAQVEQSISRLFDFLAVKNFKELKFGGKAVSGNSGICQGKVATLLASKISINGSPTAKKKIVKERSFGVKKPIHDCDALSRREEVWCNLRVKSGQRVCQGERYYGQDRKCFNNRKRTKYGLRRCSRFSRIEASFYRKLSNLQ